MRNVLLSTSSLENGMGNICNLRGHRDPDIPSVSIIEVFLDDLSIRVTGEIKTAIHYDANSTNAPIHSIYRK